MTVGVWENNRGIVFTLPRAVQDKKSQKKDKINNLTNGKTARKIFHYNS